LQSPHQQARRGALDCPCLLSQKRFVLDKQISVLAGVIVTRLHSGAQGRRATTASIELLVLAVNISHPPSQMIPFLLAVGLCRPPTLPITIGGWHKRPLAQ
jgi:hypothetical protein